MWGLSCLEPTVGDVGKGTSSRWTMGVSLETVCSYRTVLGSRPADVSTGTTVDFSVGGQGQIVLPACCLVG